MLKLPEKSAVGDVDVINRGPKHKLIYAYAIALWYNGVPFANNGKIYHIGCSRPPKLQTLIGCTDKEWKEIFLPIQEEFLDAGFVKERNLIRRKVKWSPSLDFRKTLGEIFGPLTFDLVLHDSINESVGLVGDWNESLTHRMGVERLRAIHERRGCHTDIYPTIGNETTPDIYWYEGPYFKEPPLDKQTYYTKWGGEVLTDHNNAKMPVNKYQAFSSDTETRYVWVFENRAHAAHILSALDYREGADCSLINTPYYRGENYSIKTLNEYIERSRLDPEYSCEGIYRIETLTTLQNQIDEPHGNIQYRHPPSDRTPVLVN